MGRVSLSGEGVVLGVRPGRVPLGRQGNNAPSSWAAAGEW